MALSLGLVMFWGNGNWQKCWFMREKNIYQSNSFIPHLRFLSLICCATKIFSCHMTGEKLFFPAVALPSAVSEGMNIVRLSMEDGMRSPKGDCGGVAGRQGQRGDL